MKHNGYKDKECHSYKATLNSLGDFDLFDSEDETVQNVQLENGDATESEDDMNHQMDIIKFQQSEFIEGNLTYSDTNNGKDNIFTLPYNLWPRTPLGHRWVVGHDNKANFMRHQDSVSVKTEVSVYGPDADNRVNYITLFEGVNVQSFCHTRPADDTYCHGGPKKTKQINRYPSDLTTEMFKSDIDKKQYIRGHCIDYKDTIDREPFSSSDKINLLPEVDSSIYYNNIRNWHVHDIRKNGNAYMQIPYYDDKSNYHFYSSGMINKTKSGALVPKGVFLTEIELGHVVSISSTLDFSWSFPYSEKINNTSGTYRACAKPYMNVSNDTLPLPMIFPINASVSQETIRNNFNVTSKSPVPEQIKNSRTQRFAANCLLNYAEREIDSPNYKLLFAARLSQAFQDKENTKSYLSRAKSHGIFLESLDDKREIINLEALSELETQHFDQSPGFEDSDDLDFWQRMSNR